MNSLKRIDFLFFVYLLISTLLLLFSWNQSSNSLNLMMVRGFVIPLIFGLIYLDSKKHNSLIHLLRMTYPLILSGYFYSETVFYNKLLFDNIDPLLVEIESAIFGTQPSIVFSAFFSYKLLSEIMYFGYFSFYLLIASFTLYMFLKKKEHFNKTVFQISASLYLFYLIFCFIPSAGPQFYFLFPDNALPQGYLFEHIMHFIQRMAEQPTGAFPSSHVGVALIILILSRKMAPVFFKFTWPFVFILILSTVFIKAHYAIDILGGIIIAPLILYLSDLLYRFPARIYPGRFN